MRSRICIRSGSAGWSRPSAASSSKAPGLPIRSRCCRRSKSDPVLRHHFRPGNVITTVDAVNRAAASLAPMSNPIAAGCCCRPAGRHQGRSGCGRPMSRVLSRNLRSINPDAPLLMATDPTFAVAELVDENLGLRAAALQSTSGFYCEAPVQLATAEGSGAPVRGDLLRHDSGAHHRLDGLRPLADNAAQPSRREGAAGEGHSQHRRRRAPGRHSRRSASGPHARSYGALAGRGSPLAHRVYC